MSGMEGNEYHERAEFASELVPSNRDPVWDATVAGAIATLALAYEQRTANLIAVATAISPDGVYALSPKLTDAASVLIAERLGLEA